MLFLLQWTHSMRRITILKFWILTFFACHSFLSKLAFLRLLERLCKIMWNHKHPNRNEWCNKKLLSHFHNNCFWFCCVTYLIFLFLLNKNAFNVFLNTVFTRLLAAPYKAFFSSFRAAYDQGQLTIEDGLHFFLQLVKMSRWRSVFPWLRFVDQTLFAHYLSSLQHHVHIHHRRDYDEQKAVIVVNQHCQGCWSNPKHAIHESISKA